jgi:hypothetical protein
MIINRIYEHRNLVTVACLLPVRAKELSAPLYVDVRIQTVEAALQHDWYD